MNENESEETLANQIIDPVKYYKHLIPVSSKKNCFTNE